MKNISSATILKLLSILLIIILFGFTGCGSSYTDPPTETETPVLEAGDTGTFTLLQTTDVHHRASGTGASAKYSPLDGTDTDSTEGGYARLATQIAAVRLYNMSQLKPTVLVDSGDFLMGTVYDMTLGVTPAAFAFIEMMKYDAITLGNHEFDYGPAALAGFISNARGSDGKGFTVPIVASNMVTDGADGTDDDGIQALVDAGVISSVYTKTLPNGINIGFIGLLGLDAESDAPLAGPVQFKNKLSGYDSSTDNIADADVVTALQQIVTDLKATVDVVIAISHSGLSDVATPAGDDVDLANAINGIDIIASGHEHIKTDDVVVVNNTHIFCAGNYGKNLAQLEVVYTKGSGITTSLVNHPINDSVDGNPATQFVVGMLDAGINEGLQPFGFEMNTILGATDSANLGKPYTAEETGMGNLVADSLRYLTLPAVMAGIEAGTPVPATVGIVANGVVRNGFALGQEISFADLYSTLPLGMSLDPAQQDVPGYPLAQIYLTGVEIENMCQLIAYVTAAEDSTFMSMLPDGLFKYALSELNSDYYLNLSGIQYSHDGLMGNYQITGGSVKMYDNTDIMCLNPPTAVDDATYYPCVVDIYVVLMMKSDEFTELLTGLSIPIVPKGIDSEGSVAEITIANIMNYVIKDGENEVKEWQALLTFLTSSTEELGLGNMIPDSTYGNLNRVNP